jgi:hypothetical protein
MWLICDHPYLYFFISTTAMTLLFAAVIFNMKQISLRVLWVVLFCFVCAALNGAERKWCVKKLTPEIIKF